MPGIVVHLLGSADLHDLAGVHNGHPVRTPCHHAQIVRNKDRGRPQLGLDFFQQIQDLCLDGHIQSGGGFVCQQDLGICCQSDSHHTSLPHTAGKVVGIQFIPLMGLLDAYQFHQFNDPIIHFLFGQFRLVDQNGFRNLLSDGDGGVQSRHRILENHREQLAPELAHIPVGVVCYVNTIGIDLAALDSGGLGQQLHNGLAEHTLSAAGFAYDRKHLTGIKV